MADLSAPRLGTRDRPDEPWAFEARDYLRSLVVGKEVSFSISYTVATVQPPLEFGIVYVNSSQDQSSTELDVAAELVRAGWAKVRESTYNKPRNNGSGGDDSEPNDEESRKAFLKDLEEEAKAAGRGLWSRDEQPERQVEYSMPTDPAQFLSQYKAQPIDGQFPLLLLSLSLFSYLDFQILVYSLDLIQLSSKELQTDLKSVPDSSSPRPTTTSSTSGSPESVPLVPVTSRVEKTSRVKNSETNLDSLSNLDSSNDSSKSLSSHSLLLPFLLKHRMVPLLLKRQTCSLDRYNTQQETSLPSSFR